METPKKDIQKGSAAVQDKGKKVFVGMSGGVDSSVAALLLKEQGYEVTGAFIKTWHPDWMPCPWREERRDAMRVAAKLGIPFVTIDCSEHYHRAVAEAMIAGYSRGETPNPDILCNREVKFGLFWQKARELGAEYIATGHYAQNIIHSGKHFLCASADTAKDQSYFLWTLTTDDLEHTLFPVGHMQKTEVRAVAARAGLSTSEKKDSQGICFLGDVDMNEFLGHYCDLKEGSVLDIKTGERVGTHKGALLYTIGQRHGFDIDSKDTNRNPYYVVAKDMASNTLHVGHKEASEKEGTATSEQLACTKDILALRDVSMVNKELPHAALDCKCRLRYRQNLFDVTYTEVPVQAHSAASAHLKLKEGQYFDVGQSAVLYREETVNDRTYLVCLGGGIITSYVK